MKRAGNVFLYMWVAFIVSLLAGCGSPKVKVNVAADQALNQDNRQRSLPVVVRVYQLGSKTKFEQADFKQIWKQDESSLSNDVLARDEYLVHPGKRNTFKMAKVKGVHYVGVVALFRDNTQQEWRVLKSVGQTKLSQRLSSSLYIDMKDKTIYMSL